MSDTYPHMCRDGHVQIGHSDSSHEMCPLCRALSELEQIREVFQHGADDEYWEPGTTLSKAVAGLKHKLVASYRELSRLKRGDFTKEEFQNLCHNRHDKEGCTLKDFYDGCAQFQKQMFGMSERDRLIQENNMLRNNCEGLKQLLAKHLEKETPPQHDHGGETSTG